MINVFKPHIAEIKEGVFKVRKRHWLFGWIYLAYVPAPEWEIHRKRGDFYWDDVGSARFSLAAMKERYKEYLEYERTRIKYPILHKL